MGSIERFLGILIEHYGGALPAWLAPVQASIVPVADRHVDYANEVKRALDGAGVRGEVDVRSESVSKKIRDGEVAKVPYMLVVGDREVDERSVTIRTRGSKETESSQLPQAVAAPVESYRPPAVASPARPRRKPRIIKRLSDAARWDILRNCIKRKPPFPPRAWLVQRSRHR